MKYGIAKDCQASWSESIEHNAAIRKLSPVDMLRKHVIDVRLSLARGGEVEPITPPSRSRHENSAYDGKQEPVLLRTPITSRVCF